MSWIMWLGGVSLGLLVALLLWVAYGHPWDQPWSKEEHDDWHD